MRRGTAKIEDQDCILLLPADTPYALQELLDQIDWRATRHGPLRVELDQREWRVAASGTQPITCAACTRPVRVGYVTGSRPPICGACARSQLTGGRSWRSAATKAAAS